MNSGSLDHEQIRALYEHHGAVLLAYAVSLLQDRAASEDVLHSVFVKLLKGPAAITGPPLHYLYRAMRNTAFNYRRKAPLRLVNVTPVYPDDAKAAGIEGAVILHIVIGEDGSVIEAQVLRSIPELDQAALDAAYQWRYEPTLGESKGQRSRSWELARCSAIHRSLMTPGSCLRR